MRGRFVDKPLDFDEFMDVVVAAGADPYLVLNYDSANKEPYPGGERWDYDKLRNAAESWVAYIVRKGYEARALPSHAAHHLCLFPVSATNVWTWCARRAGDAL